jgi:hypothetical protein
VWEQPPVLLQGQPLTAQVSEQPLLLLHPQPLLFAF